MVQGRKQLICSCHQQTATELLSQATHCHCCWVSDNGQDGRALASKTSQLQHQPHPQWLADPLQGILGAGDWNAPPPVLFPSTPRCSSPALSCINSGPWSSCETPCVCFLCMCQARTKASALRKWWRAGRGEVGASSRRQGLTYWQMAAACSTFPHGYLFKV